MRLSVGERERGSPRAAEHLPAFDSEVLAKRFEVGDEVPRGVVVDRGMRERPAAATLIDEYDAVKPRIVKAAHNR